MFKLKKNILILFILFVSNYAFGKEGTFLPPKLLLSTTSSFSGYVIENDNFYVISADAVYQFRNATLEKLNVRQYPGTIVDNSRRDGRDYENFDNKLIINKDKYIELVPYYTEQERVAKLHRGIDVSDVDKLFKLVDNSNGIKKIISKNYRCIAAGNNIYIDSQNEKIYFYGFEISGIIGKRTKKDVLEDVIGIFVCDIKTEQFSRVRVEKRDSPYRKTFTDPIRIPNTKYLIYHTFSLGGYPVDSSEFAVKEIRGMEVWIQEIPQWEY
ncbi:hypothetical protein [Endomicrobium proavitum]|uniref:Uncharacterized protein n=1 Tax=Endomicrobium proavitum TaxID=1408281 RepID=A0A0G3WIB4_9BACT|nr:hypothetical protein [Endomicrobium proavitum]AKL98033.1 exported protein of unknown function [Endomicrobium proavitum]